MKKKLLTILLSVFMMLMVLPETVFAASKVNSIDVSIKTGYGETPVASYHAITPYNLLVTLKSISYEYKDSGGATITTALIEGDYTVNVTVEVNDIDKGDVSLIDADVTVNESDNGISILEQTAGKITFTYSFHVDAPLMVTDILKTNPNFPTSEANAWVNENGEKLYRGTKKFSSVDVPTLELVNCLGYYRVDKEVTKSGSDYVVTITGDDIKFVMNDGVLEKITISSSSPAEYCGTYCAPLAISDILPSYFPTSYDKGWSDQSRNASINLGEGDYKVFVSNGYFVLNKNGSENICSIETSSLVKVRSPFEYEAKDSNENVYVFGLTDGIVSKIEITDKNRYNYGHYYIGISEVLSKSKNAFPTDASNGWLNAEGKKIYFENGRGIKVLIPNGGKPTELPPISISDIALKNDGNYIFVDRMSGGRVLFEITNNYLVSVVISNYSIPYDGANGTYIAPVTIADILPDDFPTTSASGWINENGARSYKTIFKGKDRFAIYTVPNGEYGPFLTEQLTKVGDDYSVTDEYGATIKYVMDSGELKEIVVSGGGYDGTDYAGTYAPYKSYDVTDGKQASIDIKKGEDVLFTSKAEFSKFVGVKIDGNLLTETTDYTKAEGSTKITVKAAYLNTLAVGSHTIEILSKDGSAKTTFTITNGTRPHATAYAVPNTGIE